MGRSHTILLALIVAVTTDPILAACPKQNILDDILSPANAERALQILQLAAVGANKNVPGPGILEEALPRFLPSSLAPAKQILSEFYQRRLPVPRAVAQPIVEVAPVLPEFYPPAPKVIQEKVFPGFPIPQPCTAPALPVAYPPPGAYPPPAVAYPPPTVSYPPPAVAYPPPNVAYPPPAVACPPPIAPAPLVNPFLPAASPVSALAPPTSNLLPPVVPTQVRSHFLRKIPIPPPCL